MLDLFFIIDGISQYIPELELNHNLPLISACGCPEYTNFVSSFHGCLDYIYVDEEQFDVTEVIPLPSHDDVTKHTALPNKYFPSDHMALVCKLKMKNK